MGKQTKIVMMSGDRMDEQNKVEPEQNVTIKKYLYVTPDSVAMYVIPENLVGKYSYKELTGGNADDKEEFDAGASRYTKEPEVEMKITAEYDFKKLQEFFKVVKTLKADAITISLSDAHSPIKIVAKNKEGETITFWLAPRIPE